jgi:hypothetical protein
MEKVHFEDLTKVNIPFGLLDEDTQTRMKPWEHGLEMFYQCQPYQCVGRWCPQGSQDRDSGLERLTATTSRGGVMLYLIRGLPGSGKSTLATQMLNCGMVDYRFEADLYFVNPEGEYRFDPTKIKDAHKACQDATRQVLREGKSVAVANTFTQMWELKPYLKLAEELGVQVSVITKEGDYGNIHGVPEEAITRMRKRWEKFE